MLRAAKQHLVSRTTDPVTAAEIMQHSLETALDHYNNGAEEEYRNEMGDFFDQVEKVVIGKDEDIAGSIDNAVGTCMEFNNPISIIPEPPATPDCKRQSGCLFCEKYRVHADEIDVRKLWSLHFCIRETAFFADSAEEHNKVFGTILRRIEWLVTQIEIRNNAMIDVIVRIKKEIDIQGMLDTYWATKLEFIMMLGEI
jgi:hypothetical protein